MTKSAVRVLDPLELQSGSELSSLRSAAGHLFTGVDHVLQEFIIRMKAFVRRVQR